MAPKTGGLSLLIVSAYGSSESALKLQALYLVSLTWSQNDYSFCQFSTIARFLEGERYELGVRPLEV